MSGRPVNVAGQTAIIDTHSRYRNMTSELTDKFARLGSVHVFIGVMCNVLQIISIIPRWEWIFGEGISTEILVFGEGILTGIVVKISKFMKLHISSFNVCQY